MILALVALSLSSPASDELVAVKAGTILAVENDAVVEHGGVLLLRNGKIVAVGKETDVPAGSRVVDYGPDAMIVPGLVAADSTFGISRPSERTADLGVRGIDGFDTFGSYVFTLQGGVTSAYLPPARGRLIAGQGSVVKLAGRDDPAGEKARILSECAAIHGAVSAEARATPGYWQPPIPATVDVGMGVEQPQLPRTLMGAVVALQEIVTMARGGPDSGEYGPELAGQVRGLIDAKTPWRMAAVEPVEIRALLDFFTQKSLPLVIDEVGGADVDDELAGAIAKAGASVIVDAPFDGNRGGKDVGRDPSVRLPRYDVASVLARAKVRFAIAASNRSATSDLRFAAQLASRGGLSKEQALRAITLSPAEILGVADKVGSLVPGKDADFAVFNGHPLEPGSSVLATWVGGEIAYKRDEPKTAAVVLSVDELYTGEGEVLRPGEILIDGGKIAEVGRKVGRPAGATIVHGKAAMPGMIDALGHLGLDGSNRVPATRFDLAKILEPGDATARRVARAGVTTVVLSPRGASRTGAPILAYKPASPDAPTKLGRDPTALRFQWSDRNRLEAGKSTRETLEKAVAYAKKWEDYEKKLAAWVPPKDAKPAEEAGAEKKKDEAKPGAEGEKKEGASESGSEAKKEGSDEKKAEGDKGDAKKKPSKSSGKGDKEAAKPVAGAWEGEVAIPPFEKARIRLYVNDEEGKVSGTLRCASLATGLVPIAGERKEKKVALKGEGDRGPISLDLEEKDGKLDGKVVQGSASATLELKQTSTEYEVAKRTERRKPKESEDKSKKEIKGQPKPPGIDAELEPLRRAMKGQAAVVVGVDREDEILDCVAAFEASGIKPILFGARDAWKVADKIHGKVSGILLGQQIAWTEPRTGATKRNRYEEIVRADIPIAFHSDAEDGASDLPSIAAYAVSEGMSAEAALRALTSDAARMFAIDDRVGVLAPGLDADVALLDGSPLDLSTSVQRVWVAGEEVR